MRYTKVSLRIKDGSERDLLVAGLAEAGYEGFEEKDDELLAYIGEEKFNEDELKDLAGEAGISYHSEVVPEQNWNALWESNFEPVVVDGFCTIKAHFHDIVVDTPYTIRITPKMSFGTGHHATTRQMMVLMRDIPFEGHSVLDFGTGTGVLAILAEMLGAAQVHALDNDEWSVENTIENVAQNGCKHITTGLGVLEGMPMVKNDVILANINRNILIQYMEDLYQRLNARGTLLMSGLLEEDKEIMMRSATGEGFTFVKGTQQGDWIALQFTK